jgi:hypothetical protein
MLQYRAPTLKRNVTNCLGVFFTGTLRDIVVAGVKSCKCCSQVFYYLRSLDDALTHALGAGALFDISEQSEYVKTIVGKPACHF